MTRQREGKRSPQKERTDTENSLLATFDRGSFSRRQVLATVGAAVVVPAATSEVGSATEHGYGAGAYGDGPYGDSLTDEPTAVPRITRLDAADTSNPNNPHADVFIEWEASIADGTLGPAELTVSDSSGQVLSWNYDLSGQSATESESRRIKHGGGVTYTVELTVNSTHGTTESAQTTFDAP